MLVIPVASVPNQTLSVLLSGQDTRLNIYQKTTGLYVDVLLAGVLLVSAAIARDRVPVIRHGYLGFVGDVFFKDLLGASDPTYSGLGSQYVLGYQTGLL